MKHLLPPVPGCAAGRMQAAGPDRRRQALPHYRRNGGSTFLLDAARNVSRETSPDRDHDQNTGITTAARRNGPAAGGLPPVSGSPECPRDSSAPIHEHFNRPTSPACRERAEHMFHVKHRRPSISGCATSRMQTARTKSLATSPSAVIDGAAAASSCRMPGGMFHVKRARTAPTPETPGSQPSPARMAPPLEICRPCPATRSIPGIQAAPISEHSNCPTGLPTRSWRSACFT